LTTAFRVFIFSLLLACAGSSCLYAGGLRGKVTDESGAPLANASVYVRETGTGGATDVGGQYEILLPPGKYEVIFQYLGYQATTITVQIGNEMKVLDVRLKAQTVELPTLTIRAKKEDPAYSVMRRAIARAKYHLQQVDSFSATVYIKGKGKLKDFPFLAKKMLEKEGITKDRLFIQESVSEVRYKRPNKFTEKVIAIYTQGKNSTASPNEYIFGSFYEPEIAETISPLSPKAFSYYRFEYVGIFKDGRHEVNKIKVIPRSKGDNVFDGVISIVEDSWSIHSVELTSNRLGIRFNIRQLYLPVLDAVNKKHEAWMPVNQNYTVGGSVFGFEFEGQYLATVRDYKVFLNPKLQHDMVVVDVPRKEQPAAVVAKKDQRQQAIKSKLEKGEEVSTKELSQFIKTVEKEEARKSPDANVTSDRSFKVDSLASKKDSVFWSALRPAPLEREEIRGYIKADSLATIEKKKAEGDSAKESKSKGFQLYDLVFGDRYKVGKTTGFEIKLPYGGFNSVEGWNLIYRLGFDHRWVRKDSLKPEEPASVTRLDVTPVFRYAMSTRRASGFLRADLRMSNARITMQGGRYVQQLNPGDPIHPLGNSFSTLVLARNYMKILERDFVSLTGRYRASDVLTFTTDWSYNNRRELSNNTYFTFFGDGRKTFTSNTPEVTESGVATIGKHQAFIGSIGAEVRPWQQYRIRNGRKYRVEGSPWFVLGYRKGFGGVMGSDVDYDLAEIGYRHALRLGYRGRLEYRLDAGAFLNTESVYFPDYKHFPGNRTFLMVFNGPGSFRLLDYYRYSTADRYFTATANYYFRKFMLTRVPKLRLFGIRENVFGAYLTTPYAGNYFEAGYGIDGILRVFRIEGAVAFQNGRRLPAGIRIGIAASLAMEFGD